MNWFQKLLSNPFLLIGLSSWFWAQLIKTIIHAIVTKSIDFTRLIGDGGMPSGHSDTDSSLATAADIAKRDALLAEKKYDDEMFRYARQFAAADRIVIAAPLWDLSFPAQLKVYLENIYVTGIVTKYSEAGEPVGLCRASELYHVTTSGGPFDGRFGYDYWKTIAQDCFGIPTVKLLEAENLDIMGADAEKIVDDAIKAYGPA